MTPLPPNQFSVSAAVVPAGTSAAARVPTSSLPSGESDLRVTVDYARAASERPALAFMRHAGAARHHFRDDCLQQRAQIDADPVRLLLGQIIALRIFECCMPITDTLHRIDALAAGLQSAAQYEVRDHFGRAG